MKTKSNSPADILDECLRSMLEQKATLEDCLHAHPDAGPDLQALLETAVRVHHSIPSNGPAPEYLASCEARLRRRLRAANDAEVRRGAPRSLLVPWRMVRAGVAIFIAAALLVSGWGVFSASAQSLPADPLYPAKLEFERLSLTLSWSPARNVTLLADYCDRRLEEIQQLINKNREQDLSAALENYESTLDLLDAALQRLPANVNSAQLEDVQARLARHHLILQDLRALIPSSDLELFDRAIDRSSQSQELIQNLQLEKGPDNTPPGQQRTDTQQPSQTEQQPKQKIETPLGQQITETQEPSKTAQDLKQKTKTPPGQQKKDTKEPSKTKHKPEK
jgi:hypothetical protein